VVLAGHGEPLKKLPSFLLNRKGHGKVTVKSQARHYRTQADDYISGCHGNKAVVFEQGGSHEKNSITNLSDNGFRYFNGRR
jgi:hypothetical protein